MPDRDTLLRLADLCEKAEGPSRELDGRIWCVMRDLPFVMWDGAGCVYRGRGGIGHIAHNHVSSVTASLDEALSLVPDRWAGDIWLKRHNGHHWTCELHVPSSEREGRHVAAPLAVCAAALRARASSPAHGEAPSPEETV